MTNVGYRSPCCTNADNEGKLMREHGMAGAVPGPALFPQTPGKKRLYVMEKPESGKALVVQVRFYPPTKS